MLFVVNRARDITRGQQEADALSARFVQLDVTDDTSVTNAVRPSASLVAGAG